MDQRKAKNFRQSKSFRVLKRAMLENLDFWVLQQELKADIARRGLTVTDDRGRQTENRSVSLAVQVSRQMMALFNAMGFKTSDFVEAGDGDVL